QIQSILRSKQSSFAEAYWNIGKELCENASYGKSVVEKLFMDLRLKYSDVRRYSITNLWNMKRFYDVYQKLLPVVGELLFNVSWTNYVLILNKTNSDEESQFYLEMCVKERRSKRELDKQIDFSLFERYMLVDKPERVTTLIPKHESEDITKHLKYEYMIEFLNLNKEYLEQELEEAILNNIRNFFLEFGRSFTFVGLQYILDIGGRENRIDLLLFHKELKCLVAVDLKISEFKAEYVGQMQKYLAALDEKIRLLDEKESVGLILCKSKNYKEVWFAIAKTLSSIKVAAYKTKLPDKKLILERLKQFRIKKCVKSKGKEESSSGKS
ncbi:MAG: PDDEXK nuclease domain-containing protein, partial [Candidatus Altarchaeum sp.]|nr:PDDEXK nuclease domain-containing protein [Candidatus Altarchaeum sp.]